MSKQGKYNMNTRVRACWTDLLPLNDFKKSLKSQLNLRSWKTLKKLWKKKYEPCNSVDKKKSKKDWNARILVLDSWTYNDWEFDIGNNARRVQTPQV